MGALFPLRERDSGMGGGWIYGPRMGPIQDSEVIISPTGEPFSLGSFEHHKWLHGGLF